MIDKVGTATDSENEARPIQIIFVNVILSFVAGLLSPECETRYFSE
jgi:hypothetical protein